MGGAIKSIFGGGGGGNITYNVPQPAAPTPIDYDKMYAAATKSAIDQMREQEAQIQRLVPTYENLQFNTVNRLAQGLDNQYLAILRNTISREMGAAASPSAIEAEVQRRAMADMYAGPTAADRQIQQAGLGAMGVRADQVAAQQVGPGELGQALMSQAIERAQSQGRLSPEASRDAVQSARAGMAARGMATGSAGLAAELLNRDAYSRARMTEDNAFAAAVQGQDLGRQFQNQEAGMRAQMSNQAANQNQLEANRMFMLNANNAFIGAEEQRRNQALGANQLDLARRQRLLGLAGGYAELDPFARATGPAFEVGRANTGDASNLIGQTFGNSLTASGNVASFNTNLQGSMYNSWQNNNAAIQAANMQAGANRNAGMMGMLGGIGGGLVMGAGIAI